MSLKEFTSAALRGVALGVIAAIVILTAMKAKADDQIQMTPQQRYEALLPKSLSTPPPSPQMPYPALTRSHPVDQNVAPPEMQRPRSDPAARPSAYDALLK